MFLGLSAIWGGSYLLIKIALDGFDASMIVWARVTLAALILLFAVQPARTAGARSSSPGPTPGGSRRSAFSASRSRCRADRLRRDPGLLPGSPGSSSPRATVRRASSRRFSTRPSRSTRRRRRRAAHQFAQHHHARRASTPFAFAGDLLGSLAGSSSTTCCCGLGAVFVGGAPLARRRPRRRRGLLLVRRGRPPSRLPFARRDDQPQPPDLGRIAGIVSLGVDRHRASRSSSTGG